MGIVAKRMSKGALHIDPSGFSWSVSDPGDVLPAVPAILAAPKETIPLEDLQGMYFKVGRTGRGFTARLSTRIERSPLWDARASGECGLAPDERAVGLFLAEYANGACRLLTDFPTDHCDVRLCGRKRYYETTIEAEEVASTLREAGRRQPRNSYILRSGTLELSSYSSPTRKELMALFESLGEWCYFVSA